MAFPRPRQGMLDRVIQLIAQTPVVSLDFFVRRPIRRRIRRQSPIHRVNAKRKQMIECSLKRLQPERALREQIPVKRLHMPNVENNAVSLGNGPVVEGLFANCAEYLVRARAGVKQSGVKVVPDADSCSKSSHCVLLLPLDATSTRRIRQKCGVGRLGTLRCSLRNSLLSIEMNTKPSLSSIKTIEFRDVSFHINDIPARVIVSGISLEIPHGETLVLLGRSGSGKTTLLKLMNGMLLPTKGEVLVQDRSTADWDPIRLRRGIGYVIQDAGLFPHFTVAENVALVPTLEKWDAPRTAARVDEMLQLVGLDPREFAHRRPRELSGGQRQRVGVARALAADPPILLMDEPFGALDPITRAELQSEFLSLQQRLQKTVVFVTHDLREAVLLGTRIALMEVGRLVTALPPNEFISSRDPLVQQYLNAFSTATPSSRDRGSA